MRQELTETIRRERAIQKADSILIAYPFQKARCWNIQCLGDLTDHGQGWIALPSFNSANVSSMNIGRFCEGFLRIASLTLRFRTSSPNFRHSERFSCTLLFSSSPTFKSTDYQYRLRWLSVPSREARRFSEETQYKSLLSHFWAIFAWLLLKIYAFLRRSLSHILRIFINE